MPTFSLPRAARPHRTRTMIIIALASVLGSTAPAVLAQSANRAPTLDSIQLAGSTRAFSVMCGQTNEILLDAGREQQKARAATVGINSARFDEAFATGEEEVRTQAKTLSQAEKVKTCDYVRVMHAKGAAAAKAADARK